MFKKTFLHTLRDTLNDAGSSVAAIADDVVAKVDAMADAAGLDAETKPAQLVSDAAETLADGAAEAGSRAVGAVGSVVMVAALGGLLLVGWQELNKVHRRRLTARSLALPEPLHRWEGEGGQNQMVAEAAPLAGATGPDNSLTAEPSLVRPVPPAPSTGL